MRRRDADPDPGEAARADADEDAACPASVEQLGEHRHEALAVAAADLLVGARDAQAGAVEHGGGARSTRRIEGEDHKRMMVTSGTTPQPRMN